MTPGSIRKTAMSDTPKASGIASALFPNVPLAWNDSRLAKSEGDQVAANIIRRYIEYQIHEYNYSQLVILKPPKIL